MLLQDITQCENQWGQLGRDRQLDLVLSLTGACIYPYSGATEWDFD